MARKAEQVVPTQWALDGAKIRPTAIQKKMRRVPAGVYEMGSNMTGWFLAPAEIVTDELIQVPSEPVQRVLARVNKFRHAKPAYKQFGVLYKTGILMYGPAGCGKTALIRELSNRFVADDSIVIQASQASVMTASVLQGIRAIEPDRLIIVEMEDIDAIVDYDEEDLLALMDGSHQIDGVVYLATTNKIAELPDRIKNRPSRIDLRVYVGPPARAGRVAYLLSKWPGLQRDAQVEHIADGTEGFSFAHLKEVVVSVGCFELPVDEVLARVRTMIEATPEEVAADAKFLAGVGVAGAAAAVPTTSGIYGLEVSK